MAGATATAKTTGVPVPHDGYVVAEGAHLRVEDVQVVGTALRELMACNDGVLDAEAVVAAARPARSPLHRFFEWDDAVAAGEYRLEQARRLIRSVEVVYDTPRGDVRVRPFVHVPERGYMATDELMRGRDTRAALVARALSELEAWQTRYQVFAELADVYAAVDAAVAKARSGRKG